MAEQEVAVIVLRGLRMNEKKALKNLEMVQIQENLSESQYDSQQIYPLSLVDNENKCI